MIEQPLNIQRRLLQPENPRSNDALLTLLAHTVKLFFPQYGDIKRFQLVKRSDFHYLIRLHETHLCTIAGRCHKTRFPEFSIALADVRIYCLSRDCEKNSIVIPWCEKGSPTGALALRRKLFTRPRVTRRCTTKH